MDKVEEKKVSGYVFPDILAQAMSRVDMRTQMEASMLSMCFMGIGLVITIIYVLVYLDFRLWYKIVLVINGLAGAVFMWSYLVTTFQQYQSYLAAIEFQKNN